jgi:HEAT repeat protein
MSKKTVSVLVLGILFLMAFSFIWIRGKTDETNAPSNAVISTDTRLTSTGGMHSFIQRYNASLDPKASPNAARAYHERGHSLIEDFYGSELLTMPILILRDTKASRSDLLTAISRVRRHEIVQALPLLAALLSHQDEVVITASARTLCWFGDKRGFDFVMSKMEGPNSEQWWGIFEKDFGSQNPTEYLPRIKALLTSKAGSRVDIYVAAQVLAQIGDADSAKYLLPVIEREPHMSVDTILKLTNVRDPSVTALMQKLSKEGSTNDVKHAADVVLANQGDVTAQQRLLEATKRVTGLPQPQNADGTDKPGMKPTFIGEATPAWDGNAVFALEHGMEVVDPAQAVPVLRDIAIQADNVRFSRTAIELLAKIGDEAARNALWEVARSVQAKRRIFEDTLFTTTGKALMLFSDPTSASLATTMFSGDKHGMEVSQFLAETRGWDGLFKLDLFY